MTGSAFIIFNDTWTCSNEVSYGIYGTPVMEGTKIVAIRDEEVLTITAPFYQDEKLKVEDICKAVFMREDTEEKYGYECLVKAVGPNQLILKIFSKNKNISEILSNITFKN